MKKIKKAAAVAVAAALTASNVMVFSTSAEDKLLVKVVPSATTVSGGDTLDVTVDITNNPGVVAWLFQLGHSEYFVLDDVEFETLTQDYINSSGKQKTASSTPSGSETNDVNPYVFSWADSLYTNYYNAGTVATFHFIVDENAEGGEYTFDLEGPEPENIFDFDDVNVDYQCSDCTVTVVQAVTGVNVAPESIDLAKIGDTEQITATVQPATATNQNVSFKSADESVATVAEDGTVKAVAEGTTKVTVTTEDGGYTKDVTVKVAHNHANFKFHEAKNPTCTEEGNKAYYECKCGDLFTDEECKNPTTLAAVTIDKIDHNYVEKVDDKYIVTPADCCHEATYSKSCSMCGQAGTETFQAGGFDKTNHVGGTHVEGDKAATCLEAGNTGDTFCDGCGEKIAEGQVIPKKDHVPENDWSADDNEHWKACTLGCGTKLDKAAHSGGEATCTKKAVCEVCGHEYGEIDANNHGNLTLVGYKVATADEDGYTGDMVCDDCHAVVVEGEVIPKHEHVWEKRDAVDPTCTDPGNKEFYVCSVCLAIAEDAEGAHIFQSTEELGEAIVLPALGHDPSPAYSSDDLTHWKTCLRCGEKLEEGAHTFGEWAEGVDFEGEACEVRVCEVCGHEEYRYAEDSSEEESSEEESSEEETSEPETSETETSETETSETESAGGDNSGSSGDNKGGNPATGAASAFAVVTAAALGVMFITKRRK